MDREVVPGFTPFEKREFALCPKCGHEVREHQPSGASQPRGHALQRVGCLVCGCQLSMNEKLKAWGGRRK